MRKIESIVIAASSLIFFLLFSPANIQSLIVCAVAGIAAYIVLVLINNRLNVKRKKTVTETVFCLISAMCILYSGGLNFYDHWLPSSQAAALGSRLASVLNIVSLTRISGFLNAVIPLLMFLALPFTYYFISVIISKSSITLKSVLMALSIVSLVTTDSFLFVYFFLFLAGILCQRTSKAPVPIAILSAFFATCVTLANYSIWFGTINILSAICIFVCMFSGAYCTSENILCYFDSLNLNSGNPAGSQCFGRRYACITFAVIVLIDCSYLFLANFPGNLSPDSINQMNQIISGNYSNHHPFWHTMLIKGCYSLGMMLFHNVNSAVAVYSVFQIILTALAFSYAVLTLCEAGVPRLAIIVCVIYYCIMPYHVNYSITIWKNIPFSLSVLVYITAFYRCCLNLGVKRLNIILLLISGIGICVLQSNGLIAFIVSVITFAFLFKRKEWKLSIVNISACVVAILMIYPLMDCFDVERGDFIESLSIPAQQIARVIVDNGEITENQRNELEKIVDLDSVKEEYESYISDPVKNLVRAKKNQDYLVDHKLDYLKLWIEIGIRNPVSYIKSWIDQTRGYWNGGYKYWIFCQDVQDNTIQIERVTVCPSVAGFIQNLLYNFKESAFISILRSVGVSFWICVTCLVLNLRRNNYAAAYLTILPICVILTLLISTPVFCEFRYAYSLFTTLPVMMTTTIYGRREQNQTLR